MILLSAMSMAESPISYQKAVAPPLPSQQATNSLLDSQIVASTAPFDVATIKQNGNTVDSARIHSIDGNLTVENMTPELLIQIAYDVPAEIIVGGPAWMKQKRFDIHAKTDGVVPIEEWKLSKEQREIYESKKRVPMQKLLEDRFQLKTHFEERPAPFYALTIDKGGIKMKPSDPSGVPANSAFRRLTEVKITAKGMTMDKLAELLTHAPNGDSNHIVLNKTGLTEHYDFDLIWSDNPETSDAPSLFTALREQLGLRAMLEKGAVKVMVIDHLEMPPEN